MRLIFKFKMTQYKMERVTSTAQMMNKSVTRDRFQKSCTMLTTSMVVPQHKMMIFDDNGDRKNKEDNENSKKKIRPTFAW